MSRFHPDKRPEFQQEYLPSVPESALPRIEELFVAPAFVNQELRPIKLDLNTTRDKLDHVDLKLWGKHTDTTSRTQRICAQLRKRYSPEMMSIAWTKMFEMLYQYQFTERSGALSKPNEFRTFHLCEAPGAFICATNHYVRQNHPHMNWDWRAISLNPGYEGNDLGAMIDDDRFIRNTAEHWYFGADNSGNLLNNGNIQGCWQTARQHLAADGVDLVTADGSIDCQSDPNEQERITAPLHWGETVAALGLLHRGGCFVLKAFTLFEDVTMGNVFILSCFFDSVRICKPLTSKWGNAETYIIAIGFRGISAEYLNGLLSHVRKEHPANVCVVAERHFPPGFVERYNIAATRFAKASRDTIEENLRFFGGKIPQFVYDEKRIITENFDRWFHLRSISRDQWIAPGSQQDGSRRSGLAVGSAAIMRQNPSGTLADRQQAADERKRDHAGELLEQSSKRPRVEDAAPVYSEVAQRLMAQMGHVDGKGLGAAQDGMAAPLQVEQRGSEGLGFGASRETEVLQISGVKKWALPPLRRESVVLDLVDLTPTSGQALSLLTNSRFCRESIVRQLRQSRLALHNSGLSESDADAICAKIHVCHHKRVDYVETSTGSFLDLFDAALLPKAKLVVVDLIDGGLAEAVSFVPDATVSQKFVVQPVTFAKDAVTVELPSKEQSRGLVTRGDHNTIIAVGHVHDEMSLTSKTALLRDLQHAVDVGDDSATIVLRLGDCLSRFTASLLFVLSRCFHEVAVVKPEHCCVRTPERFVLLSGGLFNSQLSRFLELRIEDFDKAKLAESDILSLVPDHYLTDRGLGDWIITWQEAIAQLEINAITAILADRK
eukprot:TRINITY_DN2130_c0_g1_i1.p1 TRINITY_DN2130_c0_g1~~TRINITY_DN2130_c0_g1_i1.p1  ORF type:complete len:833 (+),score=195.15 TRINITY_DN2130_c0_g1_i1:60-2558(+)